MAFSGLSLKKIFALHSWTGLISGLFLLIVSLSGSILVFHYEIDDLLYAGYIHRDAAHEDRVSLDRAIRNVQRHFPEHEIRIYRFDEISVNKALFFYVRAKESRARLLVDPVSGEILKTVPDKRFFTAWLLKLHYTLFMGKAGKVLVFLIGICFAVSLITGLIFYRKHLLKVFLFKEKFNVRSRRGFMSSMHRILGSWALLINLILAITGVVLGYQVSKHAFSGSVEQEEKYEPFTASVDAVCRQVKEGHKGFTPILLRIPPQGDTAAFFGRFDDDFFLWSKYSNSIYFDRVTGEIRQIEKNGDRSFWQKADSMVVTLHYAEYGGWLVKVLYALAGVAVALLSMTGFYFYVTKGKKGRKGRPSARISKP